MVQVSAASMGVMVSSRSLPYRHSPASSRSESRAPSPEGFTSGCDSNDLTTPSNRPTIEVPCAAVVEEVALLGEVDGLGGGHGDLEAVLASVATPRHTAVRNTYSRYSNNNNGISQHVSTLSNYTSVMVSMHSIVTSDGGDSSGHEVHGAEGQGGRQSLHHRPRTFTLQSNTTLKAKAL